MFYKNFTLYINGEEMKYSQEFTPVSDEIWITYAGFIPNIDRGWMGEIKVVFSNPIDNLECLPKEYIRVYQNILCKRVEPSWEVLEFPTVKYIFDRG